VARDKIVLYMSSIMRIQATFRVWKRSQNDMILRITQIWIEERDKILAYCMKKTSKTKKQL